MPKPRKDELFGEPPEPTLEFLRLLTPPPQVQAADISKIAKFHVTENVVVQTKPSKGVAGLRSAEVQAVEFANPNYPPFPITNDPEPVYLLRLDSSKTTYERAPARWVRESKIYPRPVGLQLDAWKIARQEWDRIWGEMDGLTFEQVEERHHKHVARKTMREKNKGMIQSLSADELLDLPMSRYAHSEEAIRLGLQKPKVKKPLARPPQLLNRSISATQLRHGTLPKQSPQKLVPLATRQPPPPPPPRVGEPERRRCPRQKRVRNQIAQPTENINLSENYKLGGWYEDRSPDRPRFLPLAPKPRYDRMVIRLPAYDHSSEEIVRTYAEMPRTPYAPPIRVSNQS